MSSISEDIYSDSQQLGKISAMFIAILLTIIFILILIYGIVLIMKKELYTETVTANIDSVSCVALDRDENGKVMYNCNLTLSYLVKGKKYINDLFVNNSKINYSNIKKLQIKYDKVENNPNKIELASVIPNRNLGIILVIISIIVINIVWIQVWLTRKYKFAAAAEGFGTAYKLFR